MNNDKKPDHKVTQSLMESANRVTNVDAMPISENQEEVPYFVRRPRPDRPWRKPTKPEPAFGAPGSPYMGPPEWVMPDYLKPNQPMTPDEIRRSFPGLVRRANNSPMTNPNNPGTMPMTPTYGPALMPDGTPVVVDPEDQPMGPPYYPPGYFVRRPVDPSKFTTPRPNPYVTNPNNPGTRVP